MCTRGGQLSLLGLKVAPRRRRHARLIPAAVPRDRRPWQPLLLRNPGRRGPASVPTPTARSSARGRARWSSRLARCPFPGRETSMGAETGRPCPGSGGLVPARFPWLCVTSASSLGSGLAFLGCTAEPWGCTAVQGPQGHPRVQWLARRTHGTLCSHEHSLSQQTHRMKSAKGTGAWGGVRARSGVSFWVSSPGELCGQRSILPAAMCDNKHRVLPTRDTHPSLGVQSFYWASVTLEITDHTHGRSQPAASPR